MNNTHLSCISPPLAVQDTVMYSLRLDNVDPPDPTVPDLQLSVVPDPTVLRVVTGSNSSTLQINVSLHNYHNHLTHITLIVDEGQFFLSPRDKIYNQWMKVR